VASVDRLVTALIWSIKSFLIPVGWSALVLAAAE
jgi:hypothetical protein